MNRLVVIAALAIAATGCAGSTTTTLFDLGLECRTDQLESVVNDFGAVTGDPSVDEVFAEFFDGEGRRFSGLDRQESSAGDLTYAFVDHDGAIKLRVQLTDEYGGYLVAGYSYCVED